MPYFAIWIVGTIISLGIWGYIFEMDGCWANMNDGDVAISTIVLSAAWPLVVVGLMLAGPVFLGSRIAKWKKAKVKKQEPTQG